MTRAGNCRENSLTRAVSVWAAIAVAFVDFRKTAIRRGDSRTLTRCSPREATTLLHARSRHVFPGLVTAIACWPSRAIVVRRPPARDYAPIMVIARSARTRAVLNNSNVNDEKNRSFFDVYEECLFKKIRSNCAARGCCCSPRVPS